jgi:hypothetical protein
MNTRTTPFALGGVVVLIGAWAVFRPHERSRPPPSGAGSSSALATPTASHDAPSPTVRPGPSSTSVPSAAPTAMFLHHDINHILSTGQSLSVGVAGWPVLSKTQPYRNLMFSSGVIAGRTHLSELVPLVEGGQDDVETMSSALANLVTRFSEVVRAEPDGARHDLLVSVHGVSGTPYAGLKKGTDAYATGIAQARAAMSLAKAMGKSYVVRAVTNVHGESDHTGGNRAYENDLARWQADYETDVKAITSQSEPIPMLQTQMSSWTQYGQATSIIPAAQLAAHVASNGKVVLVGPKYHVAYAADGVHLTNEGYRHMGEDYAKVYRRVVLERGRWEPLRPSSVARSGAVITVKFHVPVPPIAFDEKLVKNPGNLGFEVEQTGAPTPAIASIAIAGPDTVTITLAAEPAGAALRLRYAFTGAPGAPAGAATGARGNLRDSDATVSGSGHALYNWCIHFDEAVP